MAEYSARAPQMSKESKEAVINQRIDEIRRRNEEILRRYQLKREKNYQAADWWIT